MTTPTRTWTFLAHTLEQVGPPVFLLHLLRWLHDEPAIRLEVVALAGGALLPAFEALGSVAIVGDPGQPSERSDSGRPTGVGRLALPDGTPERSLIYVNTAASVRALPAIDGGPAGPDIPLIAHIHELEVGLSYHLDDDERFRLLAAKGIVAASQAVAENLISRHGVDADRIKVHHEFIAINETPPVQTAPSIRASLGIPASSFVVGTAAVVNWRKGTDLFLQVALRLARRRPDLDVHHVWIGGREDEQDTMRFDADISAAGLADQVHLTPFVDRPLDWMRTFDLFALTAREDAYPIAGLEAASIGLPIICFASGGIPEFVESDAGVVVEFGDVDGMVAAIAGLADDPGRREQLGRRAAAKVRERHEVGRVAPALVADLKRWEGR